MKPIVAITPGLKDGVLRIGQRYAKLLEAAGALGVLLPMGLSETDTAQVLDTFDGVLFSGGVDIDPMLYGEALGEAWRETVSICAERDSLEIALCRAAWSRNKPMLGICRGIQSVNVALGGTLWQDIPAQCAAESGVCHNQSEPFTQMQHAVNVLPDTPLAEVAGTGRIMVNSMHHQAIKVVAPCLKAMANTDGGLVEAVYAPQGCFMIGVQWHPEYLWETEPCELALVRQFVDACRAG